MSASGVANSLFAKAAASASILDGVDRVPEFIAESNAPGVESGCRLGDFLERLWRGRGVLLRPFLRESILDGCAGLVEAEALQVTATVSGDALVQLSGKFIRSDLVAGRGQRLEQLKRQLGAFPLR